ncbi:Uncharacterized protein HZ326_0744 [Fusarium oxysporum f. sp. albedinis]|nr:Uncharacterized protein HZ326_0744 [Fusarium oxysporum f. sp. albedinis]
MDQQEHVTGHSALLSIISLFDDANYFRPHHRTLRRRRRFGSRGTRLTCASSLKHYEPEKPAPSSAPDGRGKTQIRKANSHRCFPAGPPNPSFDDRLVGLYFWALHCFLAFPCIHTRVSLPQLAGLRALTQALGLSIAPLLLPVTITMSRKRKQDEEEEELVSLPEDDDGEEEEE